MTVTVLDVLRFQSKQMETSVLMLLEKSGMRPVNNDGNLVIISTNGNYWWNKLSDEGKNLQAQLIPKFQRYRSLVESLTRSLPPKSQKKIASVLSKLQDAVEQEGRTFWKSKEDAASGFKQQINELVSLVESYAGAATGLVFAIADTNALIRNPDLENWRFDGTKHFTLILTPAMLGELDKHKVFHKNPEVMKKAESLIRRIKDYRRRGPLLEGVTIVKQLVSLQAIAVEPDMTQAPSWFDVNNTDDRFLACALEFMRTHLTSTVFIVTSDINMQNKAELISVPYMETP